MTSELFPEPIDNSPSVISDELFIVISTWVLFPSAIFISLEPLIVALLIKLAVVLEPSPPPILLLPATDSFELSMVTSAVEPAPVAILKSFPTSITLSSDIPTVTSELLPIPTVTLPFTSILDVLSILRDNLPEADTPPRISPLILNLLPSLIYISEGLTFGAPVTPVETITSCITPNSE